MSRGKLSPEFLAKLKDAVNLIDVVSEHVVLRKSGANHSGLCPFHSERSPSFSVSEQKQLYHCYGCKKGGDLLSFVMEIHSLSFPEAVEELATRAKLAMPKDWAMELGTDDPEVAKKRQAALEKQALAFKLNRFAAAFFHQELPKQKHIESYFQARGIDSELTRNFYLGGAPASWDALSRHLVAKKAPLPMAMELGLIKPSTKRQSEGPGYFDLFRNRAIFPILDTRGRVAGFGGRSLPTPEGAPDVGGESPKYMNSSDSFIFQKGKLAYGLYQAQKHIREKDTIILVEGYFDVLALHAAGFQNAVATCGTSLTPDHLQIFRRMGSKLLILFDGDRAGVEATERAMELGLDHGQVFYGAAMPKGLDPDEVLFDQHTGSPIAGGKERMQAILDAAEPLIDRRIAELATEASQGPEARTRALKAIGVWLARFKDPVGAEVRRESASRQLGVSRELLEKAIHQAPRARGARPEPGPATQPRAPTPRAPSVPPARAPRPAPPKRLSGRDRLLLGALGRGGGFSQPFEDAGRQLPQGLALPDLFEHPAAKEFAARVVSENGFLQSFRAAPEQVLNEGMDPQVRSTLTEALLPADPPFELDDVKQALGRCVAQNWARFSQQIKTALAAAEAKKDVGLQAELMKEYLDVQRKLKEFNSFL